MRKSLTVKALIISILSVTFAPMLTGCDKSDKNEGSPSATSAAQSTADKVDSTAAINSADALATLAGCYTIAHDEPAQIKVSQQPEGWVMQMKQPTLVNGVWDKGQWNAPEPLEVLDGQQIPRYFSIAPQYVNAMLARPDRMLVLAHVQPSYAKLEPLLDSEYLAFIYKGANTIYHVSCEDTNDE